MLICAHFITLDPRHIVVKHLQQLTCTRLHWVRDNNCLQCVILRNISCFVLLILVFHCKTAVGTKDPVFKESWMWATWVISPVNITLNHHVLSWQRWLISCWFLPVSLFLTKILKNSLTGMQSWSSFGWTVHFSKRVFCAVFQAANIFDSATALVKVLLPQPRHLGSPPAVCNFRTKSLLPGSYLILRGVLVE